MGTCCAPPLLSLHLDVVVSDLIERLELRDVASFARCSRGARQACQAATRRTGVWALRAALAQTTFAAAATAVRRRRADPLDAYLAYARLYAPQAAGSAIRIKQQVGSTWRRHIHMQLDAAACIGYVRIRCIGSEMDALLAAAGIVVGVPYEERTTCGAWSGTLGTVGAVRVRAYQVNNRRVGSTSTITVGSATVVWEPIPYSSAVTLSGALRRLAHQALVDMRTGDPEAAIEGTLIRVDCTQKVTARRTRQHVARAYQRFAADAQAQPTTSTLLTYASYARRLLDAVTPRPGEYGAADT